MRHHDYIQKKVLGYMNDFYRDCEKESGFVPSDEMEWIDFIDEITNFDNYDNYIDLLITDNYKVIILQYFYSHVDENGKLSSLDNTKLTNVWINDNLKYYIEIEEIMSSFLAKKDENKDETK